MLACIIGLVIGLILLSFGGIFNGSFTALVLGSGLTLLAGGSLLVHLHIL
jgi:hypothetical protein